MILSTRPTVRGGAIALAAMLAGGLLVAGGSALANAVGEERIHACVSAATGALRVVAADAACQEGETALDWNRQGPPGQFSVQTVKGPGGVVEPGATKYLRIDCGDPNYAVSGGYLGSVPSDPVSVFQNTVDHNDTSAWRVGVVNHSETESYRLVLYATCLRVSGQ